MLVLQLEDQIILIHHFKYTITTMWITEKINNNWGKIIIILFIIFVFINKSYTDKIGEKNLKDKLEFGFTGIILNKFRHRGDIIVYKNLFTNVKREIYATSGLNDNSNIGDTIIKLPKSNLCIIKNKKKSIKVECYYLE